MAEVAVEAVAVVVDVREAEVAGALQTLKLAGLPTVAVVPTSRAV